MNDYLYTLYLRTPNNTKLTVEQGDNGYWFITKDNDGISIDNQTYTTKKQALDFKRVLTNYIKDKTIKE